MYVPPKFREDSPERIHALIDANDFGLLVSHAGGRFEATHVPFLLERPEGGRPARLVAHLARANDHWKSLEGQEVLVVFQGPHGYVSPSWYETAPAVPTWNYVAVHVHGRASLVHDEEAIVASMRALEARYERGGWTVDALPPDFRRTLLQAVVGIEVAVERVEAKVKMSQNRSEADRRGVVAGLRARGEPHDAAMAALMEAGL